MGEHGFIAAEVTPEIKLAEFNFPKDVKTDTEYRHTGAFPIFAKYKTVTVINNLRSEMKQH